MGSEMCIRDRSDKEPTPTFGSAKGLVKIEDNFDDPIEGFEPYL